MSALFYRRFRRWRLHSSFELLHFCTYTFLFPVPLPSKGPASVGCLSLTEYLIIFLFLLFPVISKSHYTS